MWGSTSVAQTTPPSTGDRVLGLDVSAWQGNISQTTWNNIRNVEDRRFVFIRSSRGGTTGYYNQSDPNNNNDQNTLSQRYDDPYFVQNITRATAAGMYAGSYHFSRPDIIESTKNSGGIRNSGTDEANHFIQMAGAWMRPGYLLPVHDLEAGISQRTRNELTQFTLDFSNRIYEVMGIRPALYINGGYTDYVNGASASLRNQLPTAYPTLWVARWPNQSNPSAIPIQTSNPKATYANFYGPWDANGSQPWSFWQYASTGRLQSFNDGNSNLDLNVAQGNIEFLKDHLVPAIWMNDSDGNWSTLANWNSGQTPVAPVQGPGQVARVGSLTLPTPRLPGQPDTLRGVSGQDDTVNLDRPDANVTVTLSNGSYNIRRLNLSERLNVTGGTLNIELTGFAYAGGTMSLAGGGVNVQDANFAPGSALDFAGPGTLNVGSLILGTNVTFTGSSGTGVLGVRSGASSPVINLGNTTRSFDIADGSANVDLRVAVPIANGTLAKDGPGTLELTADNAGSGANVAVNNGYLLLTGNNQLGTNGVRTTQSGSNAVGGTVRLSGSNLSYNVPITLGGTGFNNAGALENLSGDNTWSGNVILNGAQNNQAQPGLNQISAAAGTTLTLSGVIQNGAGSSWAKLGDGDVVLRGSSPNTYTNITRVFGGRLILEKNGALGTAADVEAIGNTFQLPGASSTIAFRAPAGTGGLNYATAEWIHTEGTGVAGFGQVDNLGGDNVFAGHLGLGGPQVGGVQQASIGVTAGSLEIQGGLYARTTLAPEPRGITKLGAGTLILSGDSGPAPVNLQDKSLVDSTFNVDAGTVLLKGTAGNTANVPGVTTWNVNGAGSTLSLARTNATGGAGIALSGGGTLHTDFGGIGVPGNLTLGAGGGRIDTANATASLTVGGGSHGAGPLTKVGPGTLVLAGANTYTGLTTVADGTLRVNSAAADNPILDGPAGADLQFGRVVFDYAGGASPAAQVQSILGASHATGFSSGQIRSSTMTPGNALGWRDDAGNSAVTVMYTVLGDADLSGDVTLADVNTAKANFGGTNDVWATGDFNYDGMTNLADLNLSKQRFGEAISQSAGAGDATARSSALVTDGVAAAAAGPDGLELIVDVVTGQVRMRGNDVSPAGITSYSFDSASGALNPTGWTSLADQAHSGWDELLATSVGVAEDGGFSPTSVDLAGFDFGQLFTPGGSQDLIFTYGNEGFETVVGSVSYVPEPASLGVLALAGVGLLARRRR